MLKMQEKPTYNWTNCDKKLWLWTNNDTQNKYDDFSITSKHDAAYQKLALEKINIVEKKY